MFDASYHQLWLDNRTGLAALGNSFSSMVAYYSAFAINTLGRQSLKMAKWNVVGLAILPHSLNII